MINIKDLDSSLLRIEENSFKNIGIYNTEYITIKKIDEYENIDGKDFMKIKLDSDDDLLLNKQLKFATMAIVVRSVFEDEGKFYPEVYLYECLYEL